MRGGARSCSAQDIREEQRFARPPLRLHAIWLPDIGETGETSTGGASVLAPDTDLILHIGHSKTASTSIQQTLARGREWLLDRRTLYPEVAFLAHNHRALVPNKFFSTTTGLCMRMGSTREEVEKACTNEWSSVYSQCEKVNPRTVILSAEDFFQRIDDRRSAVLTERLQPISRKTPRILAYVRSPAAQYLSSAQQRLKGGKAGLTPAPLKRKEVIASYERCFSTRVELHPFERAHLTQGDAVADFAAWIGLPELSEKFGGQEENQSISAEAMSVLERLGPSAPPADPVQLKTQRVLVRTVRQADAALENPTKPKLRPQVAEYMNALNPDFLELRDEYGLTFADIDYSAFSTNPVPDLSVNSVDDMCTFDRNRRDALEALVTKTKVQPTFLDRVKKRVRFR